MLRCKRRAGVARIRLKIDDCTEKMLAIILLTKGDTST